MMREITPDVPEHYMPQLQLCMEILDLETCDFIQYKPADFNWPKPEEFVVVEVKRDRGWFATNLPIMRAFWDKVLYHREHGIEAPPPKKTRPRKDKPPAECEIIDASEDEAYLED